MSRDAKNCTRVDVLEVLLKWRNVSSRPGEAFASHLVQLMALLLGTTKSGDGAGCDANSSERCH